MNGSKPMTRWWTLQWRRTHLWRRWSSRPRHGSMLNRKLRVKAVQRKRPNGGLLRKAWWSTDRRKPGMSSATSAMRGTSLVWSLGFQSAEGTIATEPMVVITKVRYTVVQNKVTQTMITETETTPENRISELLFLKYGATHGTIEMCLILVRAGVSFVFPWPFTF